MFGKNTLLQVFMLSICTDINSFSGIFILLLYKIEDV